MKVYVILQRVDYEGDELICVCSSKELAKSKVLAYNKYLKLHSSDISYHYKECVVAEN